MSYRRGKTKFPCECKNCGWKGKRVRPKRWPQVLVTAKDCPSCKSRQSVEVVDERPAKASEGWGGSRPHPPGRDYGRPKNPYPLQMLKIACTEDELKAILAQIPDTRKRAEILLRSAND